MILADTSIWVDHMRHADEMLQTLLGRDEVLLHPFVLGELALGNLHDRGTTLRYLNRLPQSVVAKNSEVFALIEGGKLFGSGIGLVDAHLLASARLTRDASLWTRDRRLEAQARGLSVAVNVLH
jgi:predicted nucleic acid-binding protein